MKLQSWKEARITANALLNWLSTHCPSCTERLSQESIDGGRCSCGKMLCGIESLEQAVHEVTHDRLK